METKIKYAAILTSVFFLSAFVAVILVSIYPDLTPFQIASKAVMRTRAGSNIFLSLLINNLIISFIIITSSIGRQKILPAAIIATNGFSIGGTIFKAVETYGIGMLIPFIPHALVELPAIILVGTLSFIAIDEIKKVAPSSTIKEYLTAKLKIPRPVVNRYIFKPYFVYVVPLFVVAAAIEAYISAQLLIMVVNTI